MDLEEVLAIGLAVNLQEQNLIIMQCVEMLEAIMEDDDEEEFLVDIGMTLPQKNRYGTFWEKDVVNNDDEFFKENFRVKRHFSLLVEKLSILKKKRHKLQQVKQYVLHFH